MYLDSTESGLADKGPVKTHLYLSCYATRNPEAGSRDLGL